MGQREQDYYELSVYMSRGNREKVMKIIDSTQSNEVRTIGLEWIERTSKKILEEIIFDE